MPTGNAMAATDSPAATSLGSQAGRQPDSASSPGVLT
jgi:hypothetical protein